MYIIIDHEISKYFEDSAEKEPGSEHEFCGNGEYVEIKGICGDETAFAPIKKDVERVSRH